ncbi:MAG TPA: NADPH:quinone oxidoreductase family protein [Acidimicrobiales bacterium]|nr:NADPH:quinone oxidoreductase family protein [Acidimicrobiales bacterium]
MRAVVCTDFTGPDALQLTEIDEPTVGPDDVLVDVKACAITFPDLLMTRNQYQFKTDLPYVVGSELAGVVREVGSDVVGIAAGDRVLGSSMLTGGLAERAVLRAGTIHKLPDNAGFPEAAGLLYAYGTSHYALRNRAGLQPGETLLVLGAAGAVGLSAIDIGHALGARVIAAASSDEKLELCRKHGADETINYETEDLKTTVRELTQGLGADVVYDPVGGKYAEPALRSTAWEGRYLVIGFAAGDIPRIPLNLTLLRGCSIVGVFWGSFVGRQPEDHRRNVTELMDWWREGRFTPYVSATYPLERAAEALRDVDGRRVLGKVVVTP